MSNVNDISSNNKIDIVTTTENNVTITQPNTTVIEVAGQRGPAGSPGPAGTGADGEFTGSFSGSYIGDGAGLENIPASGIVGLNLTQIADGTATASISATNGFIVNTNTILSGSLTISGSILPGSGSFFDLGSETLPWKELYVASSSINFVDETTGTSEKFTKGDIDNLRAGRPVDASSTDIDATGSAPAAPGLRNYIRPDAILHPTDNRQAILNNTLGRISLRTPRGDVFEINQVGANNFLQLGDTPPPVPGFIGRTEVRVPGKLNVTGSTFIQRLTSSNAIVQGNLEVLGTGSFTHFITTYESSSIIYASGSTKFGDTLDDTHARTGSMTITGSLTVTSGNISGSFIGNGSGLTNVFEGTAASASISTRITDLKTDSGSFSTRITDLKTDSGSFSTRITDLKTDSGSFSTRVTANETITARSLVSSSLQFQTITEPFTGSFTGSFTGNGAGLTNVPASGVVGLNLSQISDGAATASISSANGFQVNTDTQITGSLIVSGALLVDFNDNDNIFISTPGSSSGDNNLTTGTHNLVIGMNAGENLTDSNNNVILGHEAASGSQFASAKSNNIVIGYRSGLNANPTNYGENIFIGSEAGRDSKGNRSVFIGGGSGTNAEGLYNTAIGYATMQGSHYATTPNYNTIIGYEAGKNLWDGDNNVAIGTQALAAGDSFKLLTNNIAIGPNSLDNAECIEYSIAIGTHALGSAHNNNYPASNPQGAGYNIAIGNYAGFSEDRGKQHIFIGEYAGYNVTNSTGSIIIGSGSRGETTLNHQLRIGNSNHFTLISGSLSDGGVMIQGQVSASSYIGDGSGLTGIVTATNFTQSLFVTPSGDNSTAAVGDMMKPFATILGATGSANPGDTIIVYPGTYIENNNLYKDGVNYHFLDGAKVVANSPVEPMWGGGSGQSNGIGASSNFSSSISITGHGEFISTSSNAMASAIFYIRVPSGVIEFKKATKHGINAGPYQCLSAFGQWSAQDSTGTLTIRGSLENSGSISSYSSVASFHDGNINTDIVVRQHGGTGDGVRLWNDTGDINGTMDVYSEGYCLFTQARTSPLSYLKGRFETLTSNQGTYYALYFGPGYRGNFHVDAEVRGAIYIGPGDIYEGSVHVRGYQEVSNSPGGGAVVIASGQNQLSQRIYGASSNAIFKITGGQTTFDGTVRPTGYNSKVFDISAGTFNWKGTCTGNTSYPTTRTDPNVVSGGELVIESQFECFSQAANTNDEYMFNLSGGTLDIQSKLRNNVNQSNNGIIDMTGGYLRMNGAELVHATQTGSFAYAIDLNEQTHSGSILNNCFTNLTPFGNTGSFTNEIVGGGTLFESHKLY